MHERNTDRLPGAARMDALRACATDVARHAATTFAGVPWSTLRALDEAEGTITRWAARAILRRPSDGAVLVFRYPPHQGDERWVLPGGGVEPGEDARAAVEREVFEETGTTPRDLVATGLVIGHLLPVRASDLGPRIQYGPIFLGTIDNELPDTEGRPVVWHTTNDLADRAGCPHLNEAARIIGQDARYQPTAVWLP